MGHVSGKSLGTGTQAVALPPSPWKLMPTAARVTQRPCGTSHLLTLRWPRAALLPPRSVRRTRGLGRDAESRSGAEPGIGSQEKPWRLPVAETGLPEPTGPPGTQPGRGRGGQLLTWDRGGGGGPAPVTSCRQRGGSRALRPWSGKATTSSWGHMGPKCAHSGDPPTPPDAPMGHKWWDTGGSMATPYHHVCLKTE